jgi:hypothetical protein
MRKPPKLWRSLDRVAGQLAIPATWALEAGDDFEFLRPHLCPTDMVGALYPCPHRFGNCPRKIVDYDDGEFAAICRDHHLSCKRVPLTAKEALVHDLVLAAFLQPTLRALGIRREEPHKCGVVRCGAGNQRCIASSGSSCRASARRLNLHLKPGWLSRPTTFKNGDHKT